MVLGFGDQLFGDHFAGGAELGGDAVIGGVQVFIGLDGAFQLLADQQRLADQQHRQILLHLQARKTIAFAARNRQFSGENR
ncbi:hypothetical protein D9M71_684490 [compost metagenome]